MSQPFVAQQDPEVQKYIAAQIEEYGAFVANQPIDCTPGVRAFNTGDPVPKSTVERLGWEKLGIVDRVTPPKPTAPKAGSNS